MQTTKMYFFNEEDFDVRPRWRECPAAGYHPRGLIVKTHAYFGHVDQERKDFDFAEARHLD